MSNSLYNQQTEDLVVLAVTSNLYDKEYSVLFGNEDMKEGTLKVNSSVRADKIYTLSKYIVIKKFGSVKPEIVDQVKTKLIDLINDN